MNKALVHALRFSAGRFLHVGKNLVRPMRDANIFSWGYSRTLWHMCSTSGLSDSFLKRKPLNECCHCGCSGLIHTGGEKDLVEFLKEEIATEKKNQKMTSLPAELEGFAISTDMAELTFEKKSQYETVTISMNVNHSVDTDEVEGEMSDTMRARPSFDVDIVRNKKTLSFACSFTPYEGSGESETTDSFQINEVTYFEGDWDDKSYSVAADLLDENLYDLFMVVLSEKGVTKEFIEKVSDIATSHEHSQYIGLLENVRKFASAN